MTQTQSELFSKILTTNWDLKEQCDNNEWTKALKTQAQLDTMLEELKESMGVQAFDTFISNGRKMFASKN